MSADRFEIGDVPYLAEMAYLDLSPGVHFSIELDRGWYTAILRTEKVLRYLPRVSEHRPRLPQEIRFSLELPVDVQGRRLATTIVLYGERFQWPAEGAAVPVICRFAPSKMNGHSASVLKAIRLAAHSLGVIE